MVNSFGFLVMTVSSFHVVVVAGSCGCECVLAEPTEQRCSCNPQRAGGLRLIPVALVKRLLDRSPFDVRQARRWARSDDVREPKGGMFPRDEPILRRRRNLAVSTTALI